MQGKRERLGPGLLKTSLRADESGIALIYVTVMLPIIMGFALLAIDASRVYILNSSLQHGADAIALAMAAELDRTSDAITRIVARHTQPIWRDKGTICHENIRI